MLNRGPAKSGAGDGAVLRARSSYPICADVRDGGWPVRKMGTLQRTLIVVHYTVGRGRAPCVLHAHPVCHSNSDSCHPQEEAGGCAADRAA